MNPGFLVEAVLQGVLGGRRKRSRRALRYLTRRGRDGSFVNANALLTAAGVAWGIFETMQGTSGGSQWGGGVAPQPSAAVPVPPIPNTSPSIGNQSVPADALRMIRLAISAAGADGALSEVERARIVEQARLSGAEHLVESEVQQRRTIGEIVAGVTDPAQKATLYVLAFAIVRADESVTGAERIYLAQLANQLGLDPATVRMLEGHASARIDCEPEAEG